jgi:capsular exopolysaccharide synthesis family protein
MDLAEHLRIIWRKRWRVLGIAFVIAVAVYLHSKSLPEVYSSDASTAVTSARAGDVGGQDDALALAKNYAHLGATKPIVADAVKRSGLKISVDEGVSRIGLAASTDVSWVTVHANGPTPSDAKALASAEAAALIAAVSEDQTQQVESAVAELQPTIDALNSQLRSLPADDPQRPGLEATLTALVQKQVDIQLAPQNRLTMVQDASPPSSPESPTPKRDAMLAFLVALILNAELWVVLEAYSDRFRHEDIAEDVQTVTNLPILAEVPRGEGPEAIEAFRTLRTNLMFLNSHSQMRTVAIVGVEPGSGKSHTAIGLATSAADLEVPVALVDADLRRPVIHQRLELSVRPGLGDLRSRDDIDDVARPVPGHPFLRVIPAGSRVEDPSGLLGGGFRHVLTLVTADLVVVDTPAAGLFAEATAIAAQCDATILVLDARTTRRRSINKLVENLRRVSANPVGVVLNRVDPGPRTVHSYYDRPESKAKSSRP